MVLCVPILLGYRPRMSNGSATARRRAADQDQTRDEGVSPTRLAYPASVGLGARVEQCPSPSSLNPPELLPWREFQKQRP